MQRIGIILASVREGRRGEALARWVHEMASARGDAEYVLVDLMAWPIGSYTFKTNAVLAEPTYTPDSIHGRWRDLVRTFDAFVIVTPEYNHGYPGALKDALDALYTSWNYKPVACVTYGGFAAGARAAEQLSLVAIELKMVPIREQVNIKLVGLQVDDQGAPSEELYARKMKTLLDELVWFSGVMQQARAARS